MEKIINGKKISTILLEDIRKKILDKNLQIGLAFILVGDDFASQTYVKMKKKACLFTGIKTFDYFLPATTTTEKLIQLIDELNNSTEIHGILLQQPLPKHIDTQKAVMKISEKKDVDGFHPLNIGKSLLGISDPFYACTPYGIMLLLEKEKIEVANKHVVIMGRSNIVGKPLFSLLIQNKKNANATVTIIHSKTKDPLSYTKNADILICAMGKPKFIKKEMIKENSIIIDVGINRENGQIVGDVDFEDVYEKVSKITPVPGGIGPMTIAALLINTYKSFKKSQIS